MLSDLIDFAFMMLSVIERKYIFDFFSGGQIIKA